jgi:UDP-GlcNAc:undecaprenyl-phosphate GlcNAc-1-phosphate transferase
VSPCAADHRHVHHILVDGGMPVERTVALAIGAATASGAIGAGFPVLGIPEWAMLLGFGLVLAGACRWVAHAYAARSRAALAPRFAEALAAAPVAAETMAHE